MAKKAKKSILASVMAPDNSGAISIQNTEANTIEENSENIEVKQDVKYDDVCDKTEELARLSKENSDMTDKLATYIDEVSKLREECKNLKDECDNYLMKISSLTFENASLKAQLAELTKNKNLNVNQNLNVSPLQVRQSTNVPYIHQVNCNKNGYSDWN